MTARSYVTIWCDYEVADSHEGCHFHIQTAEHAIPAARKAAKAEGWRRIDNKDACPSCVVTLRSARIAPLSDSGRTEQTDG